MGRPGKTFREEGSDPTRFLKSEDAAGKSVALLKPEGSAFKPSSGPRASLSAKSPSKSAFLGKAAALVDFGDAAEDAGDVQDTAEDVASKVGPATAARKARRLAALGRRVSRRIMRRSGGDEGSSRRLKASTRKDDGGKARRRAKGKKATEAGKAASVGTVRTGMEKKAVAAAASEAAKTEVKRKAAVETAKKAVASAAANPVTWIAAAASAAIGVVVAVALCVPLLTTAANDGELNYDGLTDTERIVAMYLHEKGMDAIHIAAIMGNIKAESSFDPAVIESGNGIGLGLIQWSFGNRTALESYASSVGKSASDIYVQLDFLWWQMTGDATGLQGNPGAYSGVQWQWTGRSQGCLMWLAEHGMSKNPPASWDGFNSMGSIEGATGYFTWAFERPSDAGAKVDIRSEYAMEYYRILTSTGAGGGDAVARAMGEIGKPYVWGACGPSSFDCSGLVSYALSGEYGKRLGTTKTFINWPRTNNPQPGDICVNSHHCGIYIGNGQMVHAPQPGEYVKIGPVQRDMVYVKYQG